MQSSRSPEVQRIDHRLVFNQIRQYCDLMKHSNDIRDRAFSIFQQTYEAQRLKNRYAVIASCIFMACRGHDQVTKFSTLLDLVRVPLDQGLMTLIDIESFYSPELVYRGLGKFSIKAADASQDLAKHASPETEWVMTVTGVFQVVMTPEYDSHDYKLLELCWNAAHAPAMAPIPVSPKDPEHKAVDGQCHEVSSPVTLNEANDTDWDIVEADDGPKANSGRSVLETDWELLDSDRRSSVGNGKKYNDRTHIPSSIGKQGGWSEAWALLIR